MTLRFLLPVLVLLAGLAACRGNPPQPPVVDSGDASLTAVTDAAYYAEQADPCARACALLVGPPPCPESTALCAPACNDMLDAGMGGFDPLCVIRNAGNRMELQQQCNVCVGVTSGRIEKADHGLLVHVSL